MLRWRGIGYVYVAHVWMGVSEGLEHPPPKSRLAVATLGHHDEKNLSPNECLSPP